MLQLSMVAILAEQDSLFVKLMKRFKKAVLTYCVLIMLLR